MNSFYPRGADYGNVRNLKSECRRPAFLRRRYPECIDAKQKRLHTMEAKAFHLAFSVACTRFLFFTVILPGRFYALDQNQQPT